MVSESIHIGFEKWNVDEYVYFWVGVIVILYINVGIFMAKHNHLINKAIEYLIAMGLNIEGQKYSSDYVGVNIKHHDKNMISLSQPALIDTIIKDVGI